MPLYEEVAQSVFTDAAAAQIFDFGVAVGAVLSPAVAPVDHANIISCSIQRARSALLLVASRAETPLAAVAAAEGPTA